jgi:alpha-N-arabinofuranosidase
MPYQNPIIPGFYPDPSVVRVGEDYYLVNSTFEYFPGVPVFHSRDLINWRQIGHCLTRASQLPLARAGCSGGIYAPTIRYHHGLFYMVTTNVSNLGNFYVTATDPAGEWSEPILVDQGGIDPSLFFDDDGTVYFTSNGAPGGIGQCVIDPTTGRKLTETRLIWRGTGGRYVEGPHLYKIDGTYYLMCAEGGTEYGHMETIARSDSPWGPFEACPHNPILSHRNRGGHPIQGTGHAEMVQAHDGSWWLAFLGFRNTGGDFHHIGRETFLAPVTWQDGWPVVAPVELQMDVPTLPPHPWPAARVRDDFDGPLGFAWNYLRNPELANYDLTARPGWLRLHGTALTLDDMDTPTFAGQRQRHLTCRAAARVEFTPARAGDEAGLTVLMNNAHHYDLGITRAGNERIAFVRKRIGDLSAVVATAALPHGPVTLEVEAHPDRYLFSVLPDDAACRVTLGTGLPRYLSSEVAGGFTGVYFGLYATGQGAVADFDWFEYTGE